MDTKEENDIGFPDSEADGCDGFANPAGNPRRRIMLSCPQCQNPMEEKTVGGVEIDECLNCRGLWFDAGEIDAIKDRMAPPELHWANFEFWRRQADFRITMDPMHCPRCPQTALATITDRETETTVRFCPSCKGAWMTAEDFTGVVNALIAELDSRTSAEYLRESLRQASVLMSTKQDPVTDWTDLKTVLRLLKYRFFAENPKLDAIVKGLQKSLPL